MPRAKGKETMGGYGLVAREIDKKELDTVLECGELPGLTIRRLGDYCGTARPDNLSATVPITMIPDKILDSSKWHVIGYGRWKYGDHITVGESRAVVKLLSGLAKNPKLHRTLIISLQDNIPTACSMAKGRSSSFSLLRLLRQKAAICVACGFRVFMPWVQSAVQPADEASRWQ